GVAGMRGLRRDVGVPAAAAEATEAHPPEAAPVRACVRQVWGRLTDPRSRLAVEVAERYADRQARVKELDRSWVAALAAYDEAGAAIRRMDYSDEYTWEVADRASATSAASVAAHRDIQNGVVVVVRTLSRTLLGRPRELPESIAQALRAQADLLRCLFGNPFRPVSLDRAGRTPPVLALAQGAYEER